MNLEAKFLITLGELNEADYNSSQLKSEAVSLIDLTLLDETASDEAFYNLVKKANIHQVAALCVLPQHLKLITPLARVKLATVVNFPSGNQSAKQVLSSIEQIISNTPVDEIDYVFPYHTYLEGKQKVALIQCQQAYQLCKQQDLNFKVILETGALPSLEFIYQLSIEIINNGCDFLKTSTGKITQGATPSAAFAMLNAIKASQSTCGLKVSGGIKKPEQAFIYMVLAKHMLNRDLDKSWFRIGASSLLDELLR